jgi:hypothetical protein
MNLPFDECREDVLGWRVAALTYRCQKSFFETHEAIVHFFDYECFRIWFWSYVPMIEEEEQIEDKAKANGKEWWTTQ